jgi:hypothetical protein
MSNEEKKERSYILIEFEDVDSASFNVRYENVGPGQMLIASHFLEFDGKSQFAVQRAAQMQTEMQRQQMGKIVVPKPNMDMGKP